jgi:hypothetical protein
LNFLAEQNGGMVRVHNFLSANALKLLRGFALALSIDIVLMEGITLVTSANQGRSGPVLDVRQQSVRSQNIALHAHQGGKVEYL